MSIAVEKVRRSERQSRSELRARLEARRTEIEQSALARVNAIADPSEASDPAYAERLRAAVAAALEYGLAAVERGDGHEPPVPVELLAQARIAARNSVSLDTVLRRYIAGYSLLGYFMIEEAGREGLMDGAELQRLIASQATLFDRLLAAVGEEHTRESEARHLSSGQKHAERIERLLAGELIGATEIPYEFEGWHLGIVAEGEGAEQSIREFSTGLDCRILLLHREEDTVWAWLGARHRLDPPDTVNLRGPSGATQVVVALGEPGEGLAGWRLTHRQAAAALPIARRRSDSVVRYADTALLASILNDDLLANSLKQLYLTPLDTERDGGAVARQTLHAYLGADCNVSSAAAALGVNRHTIRNRLQLIEQRIGRPLSTCMAEMTVALRIGEMDMHCQSG